MCAGVFYVSLKSLSRLSKENGVLTILFDFICLTDLIWIIMPKHKRKHTKLFWDNQSSLSSSVDSVAS